MNERIDSTAPDETLARLAKQGDRAAYDALVERHFNAVFAIAMARLRDREGAEELAQEVFLRGWLHLGSLRDGGLYMAWMARMTRNLATNRLRDAGRGAKLVQMVPLDEEAFAMADSVPLTTETLAAKQAESALLKALESLRPEDRELVVDHFLNEVSQRDLAERAGVNQSTVGRRLTKALGQLRELLGELSPDLAVVAAPSSRAKARTLALIAGAAVLPAAARAELVAASTASLPAVPVLQAFQISATKVALGAVLMSTTQKLVIAAVLAIALGGAYVVNNRTIEGKDGSSISVSTFREKADLTMELSMGGTAEFDVPKGKQVMINAAEPPIGMPGDIADSQTFKQYEFAVDPSGDLAVRRTKKNGTVEFFTVKPSSEWPADDMPLSEYQIWDEMQRAWVTSIWVEKTATGFKVEQFQANSAEAIPILKGMEKEVELGRRDGNWLRAGVKQVMQQYKLLPSNPAHAAKLLSMVDVVYK